MNHPRRTSLAIAAAALATAGLVVPGFSPAPDRASAAEDGLTKQLDALLADPRYDGSQVGLVVRDANTGDVLYDRNSKNRLLPASNMKLLTSAAAMEQLGADFRFHTDALATAPVQDGVIGGDLYLKGFGDPTTLAADYGKLATDLKTAGVRRVTGDLVADDSYFDSVRLGDSWAWDDEQELYAAQVSALTAAPNTDYDSGTVMVQTKPGAAVGEAATLTVVPKTSVVRLVGTVATGAPGSASTLRIEREHGTNRILVSGSVPAGGATSTSWETVWEPTRYAADLFKRALKEAGIRLGGRVTTGVTPADAQRLARDESMPLGELMTPFLKLSNNLHAETLTKTLGKEKAGAGTWPAGLGVIAAHAKSAGADTATIRLSDGSGLTRKNNLTADAVSDVLVAAAKEPWFEQWYNALPIAGNPNRFVGGTLRARMLNTPAANNVHAKTGSLTGVTALSGYVTDADGRELVFSMISNNYLTTPRPVEDAVAVTLASYTQDGTPEAVTPKRSRSGDEGGADVECSWVKAC
ncbi:D-alanyl-D-alanine carboxypeptidase/D-alanyl-D-alanine-endopeptidase [Nocardioides speluncae]|uniref:D-alanyl-D-alanine carboxypeptidase/D-alanyl-D-alanine endopeptidase n=1 Tax=Nocardioides speluncae TaxID=2670337 RepID=UPI000D68F1B4|nr:D-alanyl-D-alanine carboxypeptidase/D-alanyl-D-alanine-endopeptidase [Nocardioides speluncae]